MKAEITQSLSVIIIAVQHVLEYSSQCNETGKKIKGIHKEVDKNNFFLKIDMIFYLNNPKIIHISPCLE